MSEIHFCSAWNLFVGGSNSTNNLYYIDPTNISNQDQLVGIGTRPIKTSITTSHLNFDNPDDKRSTRITLRMRRGVSGNGEEGDTPPSLIMRYNSDNKGWSNERVISLGLQGDREIEKEIFVQGIFKTRQYEFSVTDNTEVAYGNAIQFFDMLGSDR
jgi:hypothetical protein